MSRDTLSLNPWANWEDEKNQNPLWWRSYNKVKHQRQDHFKDANLKNVLNSVAGLLVSVFYYYKLKFEAENKPIENIRDITDLLKPTASFLSLKDDYYYGRMLLE